MAPLRRAIVPRVSFPLALQCGSTPPSAATLLAAHPEYNASQAQFFQARARVTRREAL